MPRVLLHATHHPRPEHRADLLAAMGRLSVVASGVPGLESIGAYEHPDGDAVVAVSVWTSHDAARAGVERMAGVLAGVPLTEWASRPGETVVLPEAPGTTPSGAPAAAPSR